MSGRLTFIEQYCYLNFVGHRLTLIHRSLIQLQPDIITSKVSQLIEGETARMASINSSACSTTIDVQQGRLSRSTRTPSLWRQWKSYSLLLRRAWELEIYKSQQGWQFSMHVYAVVSSDSLVVRYTHEGDIEGLQQLFSLGKASPHTICIEPLDEGTSHFIRPLLRVW